MVTTQRFQLKSGFQYLQLQAQREGGNQRRNPGFRSPARQSRMMFFGRAFVVITLKKSLFSWKIAGILTGVKLATLAFVLGLARAGLLPAWFPHWG